MIGQNVGVQYNAEIMWNKAPKSQPILPLHTGRCMLQPLILSGTEALSCKYTVEVHNLHAQCTSVPG